MFFFKKILAFLGVFVGVITQMGEVLIQPDLMWTQLYLKPEMFHSSSFFIPGLSPSYTRIDHVILGLEGLYGPNLGYVGSNPLEWLLNFTFCIFIPKFTKEIKYYVII